MVLVAPPPRSEMGQRAGLDIANRCASCRLMTSSPSGIPGLELNLAKVSLRVRDSTVEARRIHSGSKSS